MSEHTPTPWSFTGHERGLYPILAKQGPLNVQPAVAHGLSDAEMIVKAVNSHDALVTELKLIADWRNVSLAGEYEHSLRDIIRSMLDCADRALASIKESA